MIDLAVLSAWAPIIGSSIIATVLGITLFFNKRAIDQNRDATMEESNARYAQLLRDLDNDLMDEERNGHNLETATACIDHAVHYINICARIAHLFHTGRIPFEIIDYLEPSFSLALGFREWLNEIEEDDANAWETFQRYCDEHNVQINRDGVQHVIEQYNNLSASV